MGVRELYKNVGDEGIILSNRSIEEAGVLFGTISGMLTYAMTGDPAIAIGTGTGILGLTAIADTLSVKLCDTFVYKYLLE